MFYVVYLKICKMYCLCVVFLWNTWHKKIKSTNLYTIPSTQYIRPLIVGFLLEFSSLMLVAVALMRPLASFSPNNRSNDKWSLAGRCWLVLPRHAVDGHLGHCRKLKILMIRPPPLQHAATPGPALVLVPSWHCINVQHRASGFRESRWSGSR